MYIVRDKALFDDNLLIQWYKLGNLAFLDTLDVSANDPGRS